MSQETSSWIASKFLVGFGALRSWWHRSESERIAQENGWESPSYDGAIPVEDVERRLFAWTPEETPLYVRSGGSFVEVSGRKAIARPRGAFGSDDAGTVLGVFRSGYRASNYRDSLIIEAQNILSAARGDLGIASAVLLQDGAQAAVQYELPETIQTPEGFGFRPYLLAVDSCDGTFAKTKRRGVQAVVCDNTLRAALGDSDHVYRQKHTSGNTFNLSEARDVLGIVHSIGEDFAAEVTRLCAISVDERAWSAVLDRLVPVPTDEGRSRTVAETKRAQIESLYAGDARCAPWKGSALGVLQAFNTYAHHFGTVRNVARAERNMTNAISGKTDAADALVLSTLADVLAG